MRQRKSGTDVEVVRMCGLVDVRVLDGGRDHYYLGICFCWLLDACC